MCALSSVARLSVSMTMLMSSGAHRRRLYADGLVGSASSSRVTSDKRPGDDEPISSGPTPPPPLHHRPPHHRHLWKVNPKRAATVIGTGTTGRSTTSRGRQLPARIESLPNMCDDTQQTTPESAASAWRKVYGNGVRRRPQASSLSGVRRHRSHTCASSDPVTTEESSTSCGEDSSDGQVFDVIREESIRRPSGRAAVDKDSAPPTSTSIAAAASPVNNSGVSIVIDNNETSTAVDTTTLPTESSASSLSTTSATSNQQPQQQQQQDQLTDRTNACQQSGSKTFLLSEIA